MFHSYVFLPIFYSHEIIVIHLCRLVSLFIKPMESMLGVDMAINWGYLRVLGLISGILGIGAVMEGSSRKTG